VAGRDRSWRWRARTDAGGSAVASALERHAEFAGLFGRVLMRVERMMEIPGDETQHDDQRHHPGESHKSWFRPGFVSAHGAPGLSR